MSMVEFDEGNTSSYRAGMNTEEKSKIVQLLEYFGVAEENANNVMIGMVVIMIIISIFLFFGSNTSNRSQKLSPEQEKQLVDQMNKKVSNKSSF